MTYRRLQSFLEKKTFKESMNTWLNLIFELIETNYISDRKL